jgi:hypothetical protein
MVIFFIRRLGRAYFLRHPAPARGADEYLCPLYYAPVTFRRLAVTCSTRRIRRRGVALRKVRSRTTFWLAELYGVSTILLYVLYLY